MKISLKHIDRMAEWSKLSLNDQEKDLLLVQLNKILEKLSIIEELEVEDEIAFSDDAPKVSVLREDRVRPSMEPDLILENAPDIQDGMFGVPSILE